LTAFKSTPRWRQAGAGQRARLLPRRQRHRAHRGGARNEIESLRLPASAKVSTWRDIEKSAAKSQKYIRQEGRFRQALQRGRAILFQSASRDCIPVWTVEGAAVREERKRHIRSRQRVWLPEYEDARELAASFDIEKTDPTEFMPTLPPIVHCGRGRSKLAQRFLLSYRYDDMAHPAVHPAVHETRQFGQEKRVCDAEIGSLAAIRAPHHQSRLQ